MLQLKIRSYIVAALTAQVNARIDGKPPDSDPFWLHAHQPLEFGAEDLTEGLARQALGSVLFGGFYNPSSIGRGRSGCDILEDIRILRNLLDMEK